MAFKIVRMDETRHVDEAFAAENKVEGLFTYWIFDDARVVHCCELTPSRELWWVSSEAHVSEDIGERARDRVFEALEVAPDDPVAYYWASNIDRFARSGLVRDAVDVSDVEPSDADVERYGEEALYRAQIDALIEYYQGNAPCF